MKFNYDRVADAVYLALNKGKIKKTIEVKDGVVLDVGAKGKIIGIEILNFSFQQNNLKKIARDGVPLKITDEFSVTA